MIHPHWKDRLGKRTCLQSQEEGNLASVGNLGNLAFSLGHRFGEESCWEFLPIGLPSGI